LKESSEQEAVSSFEEFKVETSANQRFKEKMLCRMAF